MNLNKLNNFLDLCESSPTINRSVAIYEDFFSPTGLYLEYTAWNNTIRLRYITSNYNNVSSEYSLFTFSAKNLSEALEKLSEDTMSKITDWKSGYSTIALDIALNAINSCLDELEDLELCSLDEENKKETKRKLFNLGKPLFVHIIKLLRYRDKLNGWHHIDDINNWIRELSDIVVDSDFNFSPAMLSELLYLENNTEKTINYLDRPDRYGQLPIQLEGKELLSAIDKLYETLTDKLSSKKSDLDILDLIKEVLPELEIKYNYPNPEGSRKRSRKSKRSK